MAKMKIGIITYFYQSMNYGGILQAYALTKYLNKLEGIQAEQIRYDFKSWISEEIKMDSKMEVYKLSFFKRLLRKGKRIYINRYNKINAIDRNLLFRAFEEKYINYSDEIYSSETIEASLSQYDKFITGSDQVWNPVARDKNFFLEFVPHDRKSAYAVSFGTDWMEEELWKYILK